MGKKKGKQQQQAVVGVDKKHKNQKKEEEIEEDIEEDIDDEDMDTLEQILGEDGEEDEEDDGDYEDVEGEEEEEEGEEEEGDDEDDDGLEVIDFDEEGGDDEEEDEEFLKELEALAQSGQKEELKNRGIDVDMILNNKKLKQDKLAGVETQERVEKTFTFNEKGLEAALKRIKGEKVPWIERLNLTYSKPLIIENVHDDTSRELAIYEQALECAQRGREMILKQGLKFDRPEDYFAEMLKSEEHMEKVRRRIVEESEKLKRIEEVSKIRSMKKFGKKVQAEKMQERAKQKASELEKIKLLKKGKKNISMGDDFDIEIDNEDKKKNDANPKKRKAEPQQLRGKGAKRRRKDEKYGYGGKKRGEKSNTSDSTSKASFSMRKNKSSDFGANKKKGKKPQRPGKSKRQSMRK